MLPGRGAAGPPCLQRAKTAAPKPPCNCLCQAEPVDTSSRSAGRPWTNSRPRVPGWKGTRQGAAAPEGSVPPNARRPLPAPPV